MLVFAGCSKPTINTSSDEKMKSSFEKVKTSLPEDQRSEFEEAFGIVAFSQFDLSDILSVGQMETGATAMTMMEAFDGKTGEEIIALAAAIKAERKAESIRKEKKLKAKASQILLLAEDLRKEGDYSRALNRYEEAIIYDSGNVEIKERIVELERIIKEVEDQERERMLKVRELLTSARKLKNNDELMKALNAYEEALALDGDSSTAIEGIQETKDKIDEFKQKQAYLGKINLYDFEATTIDTYREKGIPAVKFKLKNNGDRALSKVEVTVYLKDENDRVIAEENFHPVLISSYNLSGNNKPLKAGYIWEIERGKYYIIKDAPTEWKVGNAVAKITDIEFEK